jgi:single-strand DNA-binding protein
MSLNNWNATGRLTKQAELRYSSEGQGICNFTLAVQRDYKDANGDRPADFINCVLFGSKDNEKCRATKLVDYLGQGTQVNVVARLQSRSYENQDGFKVYVTEAVIQEIYLLSQPQNKEENQQQDNQQQNNRNQGNRNQNNNRNQGNNRNQSNRNGR